MTGHDRTTQVQNLNECCNGMQWVIFESGNIRQSELKKSVCSQHQPTMINDHDVRFSDCQMVGKLTIRIERESMGKKERRDSKSRYLFAAVRPRRGTEDS